MTEKPDEALDELQERSADLGDEISEARKDWEEKKADDGVPGTPPATASDQDDSREPWPDE